MKEQNTDEQRHGHETAKRPVEHDESHTTSTTAAQAVTPKKRPTPGRRKQLFLIGALLVLVVIAGVVYWLLASAPKKDTTETKSTQSPSLSSLAVSVNTIASQLEGKKAVLPTTTSIGGQTMDGQLVADFAPYQVAGESFKSLPVTGEPLAVYTDAAGADADLAKAKQSLTSQSFRQVSSNLEDAGALSIQQGSRLVSYAIYVSDDAVCSLAHTDASKTPVASHVVSVGCALQSSYKVSAAAAKPLYEAYKKANQTVSGSVVLSNPDIVDAANGYKRAVSYQRNGAQGAGVAFYYSAPKANGWTFATLDEAIPKCAPLRNGAAAAFTGVTCIDEKTSATTIIE